MATLAKRAMPLQKILMRIIEGAVKDAMNAHAGKTVRPGSIAKRAVGTLCADPRISLALVSHQTGVRKRIDICSSVDPETSA